MLEEAIRHLGRPAVTEVRARAPGDGVEASAFDVPAVLVGLGAVEGRALEGQPPPSRAHRDHVVRDVRRVLPMMPERCRRVLPCRGPVHERGGAERRVAANGGLHPVGSLVAERAPVRRRQIHEQVVGVLPVDDRVAAERLAGLEQLRRAAVRDRGRFERVHHHQGDPPAGHVPLGHDHPEVRRLEGVVAGRASLVVVEEADRPHGHELPMRHGHARHRVSGGHARHHGHVRLEEIAPILHRLTRGHGAVRHRRSRRHPAVLHGLTRGHARMRRLFSTGRRRLRVSGMIRRRRLPGRGAGRRGLRMPRMLGGRWSLHRVPRGRSRLMCRVLRGSAGRGCRRVLTVHAGV